MIKNKKELLRGIDIPFRKRRRILLDVAAYALRQVQAKKLLQTPFRKSALKPFQHIVIFGIGKAARNMVNALLPFIKRKPDHIIIANRGHPLPTKEGIKQTKKIIAVARSLTEKNLAIVLLSGGGSAMFIAPVPEITLQDKIKITKALLKSGATIQEINVVRKHLSQVKGGRFASLLFPATVWGFVISDVVGNDLSSIASGPLSPDPSTFSKALRILKKYRIKVPTLVSKYLEIGRNNPNFETPKPNEKYFKNVHIKIIADHATVLKKAAEKAHRLGIKVKMLPKLITGEARDAAKTFVQKANKNMLIAGGETTVTCRGKGFGGRNQEFVLNGLRYLKPNQTLLAIGTDGVDGICPEPIAGAIGDAEILNTAKKQNLDIEKFLKNNDSYTFFKKTKGLIKTGPTGTNVGDLILLL